MVKYINRVDCYSCGKSLEFSFGKKKAVFYAYRRGKIRWYCKKCFNKINKKLSGSIQLEPIPQPEESESSAFCHNYKRSTKKKAKLSKTDLVKKRVEYWKKIGQGEKKDE